MAVILIADQSRQGYEQLAVALGHESNWSVRHTASAASAVSQIAAGDVELLICGEQLTDDTGASLLEKIRNQYRAVPVIIATHNGSEELAAHALTHGAAGYINRQKHLDKLASIVGSVLNASAVSKQHARLLECLNASEACFELDNDPALIPRLVARFQSSVAMFGLCDQAERTRLGIAMEEALANAIYHGNLEVSSELREESMSRYYELARQRRSQPPYCNRKVHVIERLSRDEAIFTIRDDGNGFDVSALPDPTEPCSLLKTSGRGILMMRAFMDHVHYNSKGNEVTLIKLRNSGTSTDAKDASDEDQAIAA